MKLNTRIISVDTTYKLVSYEVMEDGIVPFPSDSVLIDSEPILSESGKVVEGYYLWVLIPEDSLMEESVEL